jgi:hypothetical protein
VSNPLWEGDCVRHTTEQFIGQHFGYTRLSTLMERVGDRRGVRVLLPDGTIRVASERSLEKVDDAEYERYAVALGVGPRRPKTPGAGGRV